MKILTDAEKLADKATYDRCYAQLHISAPRQKKRSQEEIISSLRAKNRFLYNMVSQQYTHINILNRLCNIYESRL